MKGAYVRPKYGLMIDYIEEILGEEETQKLIDKYMKVKLKRYKARFK